MSVCVPYLFILLFCLSDNNNSCDFDTAFSFSCTLHTKQCILQIHINKQKVARTVVLVFTGVVYTCNSNKEIVFKRFGSWSSANRLDFTVHLNFVATQENSIP